LFHQPATAHRRPGPLGKRVRLAVEQRRHAHVAPGCLDSIRFPRKSFLPKEVCFSLKEGSFSETDFFSPKENLFSPRRLLQFLPKERFFSSLKEDFSSPKEKFVSFSKKIPFFEHNFLPKGVFLFQRR